MFSRSSSGIAFDDKKNFDAWRVLRVEQTLRYAKRAIKSAVPAPCLKAQTHHARVTA